MCSRLNRSATPPATAPTQSTLQVGIADRPQEALGQRVDVAGRGQQARTPVVDHLGGAAAVERDDRQLHGHRLEVDEPE